MESIILDLRPDYPRKFVKWFGLIVVVYVLVGIVLMLTLVTPVNLFLIISMILLLTQVIVNWYNMKSVKVTFDENGVSGLLSPRKFISLTWNQINQIDVHLFAIDILTKENRTEHIDLSLTTYKQQHLIKPKIIELAKSKGINVQAA